MTIVVVLITVNTSRITGQESVFSSKNVGINIVEPEVIGGSGIKNHPDVDHFLPFGKITISLPLAAFVAYPPAFSI